MTKMAAYEIVPISSLPRLAELQGQYNHIATDDELQEVAP